MGLDTVVVDGFDVNAAEILVPVAVTDRYARLRLQIASAAMAVFGLGLLYTSFYGGKSETESMLLSIGGVTVVMLSILFYYLSPAKFLRNDVCNAMCLSGTEFMNGAIRPLVNGGKCVYVPSTVSGDLRTLLHVSEGVAREPLGSAGLRVRCPGYGGKDLFVVPPGNGLMEHARHLGATFTEEGLEDEIRDVLVNGFELAGGVRVNQGEDGVSVEMRNVASAALCKAMRKTDPEVCTLAGCPLCSFVACMVAEGTGRGATIDEASAHGKTIRLKLRLT